MFCIVTKQTKQISSIYNGWWGWKDEGVEPNEFLVAKIRYKMLHTEKELDFHGECINKGTGTPGTVGR